MNDIFTIIAIFLTFLALFTLGVHIGKHYQDKKLTIQPVKIECYKHPKYNPELLIRTKCPERKINGEIY